MSDSLSSLMDELSSFTLPLTNKPVNSIPEVNLTSDSVEEYILNKTSNLVDTSIDAIEDIKDYIIQGQNPDEIAALSELISSATKSLEILNKINLQNKKLKSDKDLKTLELENRKQVANMLPTGNSIVNNTVNIVASREEIFKKLLNDADDIKTAEI